MTTHRMIIIGAGIVGLATGLEIQSRYPDIDLTILEKEPDVARHQTSHNSGVIHSGIYYKPGSLKATLCVSGAATMIRFCKDHGIPVLSCGKVIVATSAEQLPRLNELINRGFANGISGLRMISAEELRELEPHAAGIRAIHVPSTAITDFGRVARAYADLLRSRGGKICFNAAVTGIRESSGELSVETTSGDFTAGYGINCAGLNSDQVGRMAKHNSQFRIVPFRGEYYTLAPAKDDLVRGLIYPVPDPRFPFLGVHFTRKVEGGVEAGPNAVLALKREGYRKLDFSPSDMLSAMTFPGFWKMALRNWKSAVSEYHRSLSKRAFVRDLQMLVPEVASKDLSPGGAGVRAQAVDRKGALLDDFVFDDSARMTHIFNVPSPAATASLTIARAIADRIAPRLAIAWRVTDARLPLFSL